MNNFDYSSAATYFVTVTLKDQKPLFGNVTDSGTVLNDIGRMVESEILALETSYGEVLLDSHVVMPDHLHLVIALQTVPESAKPVKLGHVIGGLKSRTTMLYSRGVRASGWPPYEKTLWLPNYFERVVRNDRELARIREYIARNPYALLDRWLSGKAQR